MLRIMAPEICQGCGKEIDWGSKIVAVRYGRIYSTVNHTGMSKERVDYFHDACEVGIVSPEYRVKGGRLKQPQP